MNHASIVDFIKEQMSIDPKDSKKFVAMQGGIICTLVVSACAGLILLFGPAAVAPFAAQIAQIAITAIGGLVATYIGGQAAVEFRANSVLNTAAEQTSDGDQHVNINIDPPPRPFKPSATEP